MVADSSRPIVLLATSSRLPDGEEWTGTRHLLDAFAERGIEAHWVVWDDPSVDWSAGLVAVRSTWDYETRVDEFLAWADSLPWLLNSARVFAWNTDKSYLPELARHGVPVVPSIVVATRERLLAAIAESTVGAQPGERPVERHSTVVKPTVGAGGRGVVVLDGPAPGGLDEFGPGPWLVQPLVESVRTEGETSVFVLGGRVVSQAQKVPAAGEIRVHEEYGGRTVATPVSEEAADLARRTVAAASSLLGEPLDYARVDQMRLSDGTLAVSELEVTEPGLYLDVLPGNAALFADLVVERLSSR